MEVVDIKGNDFKWIFTDEMNGISLPNNILDSSNDVNIEEKLKVDRKKFEALLNGKDADIGSAETFFNNIMSEFPSVMITWPLKLKSGTKSKKDPHVKISGIPFMVKAARKKILDSLDPRRDRVTLKMDVDWTAHSHIIGKAGGSIQSVMDSTGCHVHFPDANRTNSSEKSNQVSIAGTAFGVNQARIAIRELLPILISFNLLLKFGTRSTFLDKLNRVIQFIEQLTCTQITLRFSAPNFMASTIITVFVRGIYGNCKSLKVAIELLHKFMDDFLMKDEIIYQINTEISVQHHSFVMGTDEINIKSIMESTAAIITFPETANGLIGNDDIFAKLTNISISTPTESSLTRKTTVNIKGSSVDSVLTAFQKIELHLPLSLTFDLNEGQDVNTTCIEMLSNKWNISVTVKPKPKQNTKTIWIKAAEKDEWKLFEARRYILQMYEPKPQSSIWLPNELDFSLWLQSTKPKAMKDFGSDSETVHFERAPGAERTRKSE